MQGCEQEGRARGPPVLCPQACFPRTSRGPGCILLSDSAGGLGVRPSCGDRSSETVLFCSWRGRGQAVVRSLGPTSACSSDSAVLTRAWSPWGGLRLTSGLASEPVVPGLPPAPVFPSLRPRPRPSHQGQPGVFSPVPPPASFWSHGSLSSNSHGEGSSSWLPWAPASLFRWPPQAPAQKRPECCPDSGEPGRVGLVTGSLTAG